MTITKPYDRRLTGSKGDTGSVLAVGLVCLFFLLLLIGSGFF
jgi:hypothetical protein